MTVTTLTDKTTATNALQGVVRLVAGYDQWQQVEGLESHNRLEALTRLTLGDLQTLQNSPSGLDGKVLGQLTRKLNAYKNLTTVQQVLLNEVDWDS
jgi:hypothetical protein